MSETKCQNCKHADHYRCYSENGSKIIRCNAHRMWVGAEEKRLCFMERTAASVLDMYGAQRRQEAE